MHVHQYRLNIGAGVPCLDMLHMRIPIGLSQILAMLKFIGFLLVFTRIAQFSWNTVLYSVKGFCADPDPSRHQEYVDDSGKQPT